MPKTLVVDDDPAAEAMFRDAVSGKGGPGKDASEEDASGEEGDNEFVFAATDDEAIEALRRRKDLDIAIIAVDSDAISGLKLFRKLDAEDARLPRIALTAKPDMDQLRLALKEGASDFLIKPFGKDELRAMLARVYRECQRRRNSWKNEKELSAIRREVEIAGEIQRRILPSRFPVLAGLDIFARTLQASEMGGDFYGVFELPSGSLGLVIADVAGKGIPAAFYMAVARTLIRATALHEPDPAACLEQVNRLLCRHDVPGMFVTVFYAVLDAESWEMTYANAGHPPPLVIEPIGQGEGLITALEGGGGTVLGVDEEQAYERGSVALGPGEGVFFFTDGLTEAFDFENNPFGDQRLWGCLSTNAGGSASDLAGAVALAIGDFVGSAPQHDDITNLVIKRVG